MGEGGGHETGKIMFQLRVFSPLIRQSVFN